MTRINDLFARAKKLSGDELEKFLSEQSDSDRRKILALMDEHQISKPLNPDGNFDSKTDHFATFKPPADELPPAKEVSSAKKDQGNENENNELPSISRYQLVRQIGTGGMGAVFKAEQLQPVKRQVALKVIRSGMDSDRIVSRFEAERQALAMMDHPNVAKVIDAGTTDQGKPYFAMELIQGIAITEYCDDNKLSISDRLDLFTQVCDAIQHAHQRGIVHRDIKPTNVLVAIQEGAPIVKVIDFGLAKALQSQLRLTEKTLMTEFGQLVGTLQYMSPEQAETNDLNVDTRTDIYSLGILLYELLTSSTPIESHRLQSMALDAILVAIKNEEPPRPSVRLHSSVTDAVSISKQRRIEQSRLSQILKGDLDWIVLKALEKDRTRRYESASAFADDVNRFLRDEEVVARPPSVTYRLQKTFRRHRLAVLSTMAFVSMLIAASLVSLGLAIHANRQATRAHTLAEKNERLADEEKRLRKEAEKREELVQQQKDELAVAVSLAFAILEGRYTGEQRPLVEVLRAVNASTENDVTVNNVEARAQVFRALNPTMELLTLNSDSISASDIPSIVQLIQEADARLSSAIEKDPNLGLAYLARAELWFRLRERTPVLAFMGLNISNDERISEDWKAAVRLLPDSSLAHGGYGWWIYKYDRTAALKSLNMAVTLDDTNDFALQKLGEHYSTEKEYGLALKYFVKAWKSPTQLGNVFFSKRNERNRRVDVVNSALAVRRRVNEPVEKLHALALVNIAGEGIEEAEIYRSEIWTEIIKSISSANSKVPLYNAIRQLNGLDESPSFELTRQILQGYTALAHGGNVPLETQDRINELKLTAACQVTRESLESLNDDLLNQRPENEHVMIRTYFESLNDLQFLADE